MVCFCGQRFTYVQIGLINQTIVCLNKNIFTQSLKNATVTNCYYYMKILPHHNTSHKTNEPFWRIEAGNSYSMNRNVHGVVHVSVPPHGTEMSNVGFTSCI